MAWSHMEANLGNVLMNLGAINAHVCLAITTNMGSQQLLDVVRITANAFCKDAKVVQRWNKLADKIQEIRGERNRIVHGQWTWSYKHPQLYSVAVSDLAAKGTKITGSVLHRTPASLHKVARDIFALIEEMQALVAVTLPLLAAPLAAARREIHVIPVEPDKRMRKAMKKSTRRPAR